MQRLGVDVLLVQSTDRYLNEYVPTDESTRVWISGFTGSMGEVVIGPQRAYLVVDGRYWIQADRETDAAMYDVVRVAHGTGIDAAVFDVVRRLNDARVKERKGSRGLRVGYEPDRMTPRGLARLRDTVGPRITLKPLHPSPVEVVRARPVEPSTEVGLRAVDEHRVGLTVSEKIDRIGDWLGDHDLDGLLVQRLDDIAYLSNLRGTELPYQATFKSIALVTADELLLGIDPNAVDASIRRDRKSVTFLTESELWSTISAPQKGRLRIGYDPDHNTEHARQALDANAEAVEVSSPIANMKAHKTPAELHSMKDAFQRADRVVDTVIRWACREVTAGRRVTEASFADRVKTTFEAHGAVGLSFKVISAAGKNGAIIHYSDPSPRRVLKQGELMLLDTGGYFAEGYATDLTRTFLVGGARAKASEQQRRYYTLVLKAAMAGMRAVFPEGTRGSQVDALVRAPLWAEGLNYAHGTGHGVGINVHEAPPRIAPGADSVLQPGFVFSIEPGIYLPRFGGVRIENLCTVEPAPGRKGFLRVVPLTFSPLDKRLIDNRMLSREERAWLKEYQRRYKTGLIEPTPSARIDSVRNRGRLKKAGRRKAARRPR